MNKNILQLSQGGNRKMHLPKFASAAEAFAGKNGVKLLSIMPSFFAGNEPYFNNGLVNAYTIIGHSNAEPVLGGATIPAYSANMWALDMGRPVLPLHFNYATGNNASYWPAAFANLYASVDGNSYTALATGGGAFINPIEQDLNVTTKYRYFAASAVWSSANSPFAAGAFDLQYRY